jgi:prolyl 4-hydroxylase
MRAADILGINQSLFDDGVKAESIQVVRYTLGQKYDPHYDWSVTGAPESRFITLLLYLNTLPDRLSGGETAFPKADGGHGIKVYPKKGTAVLFYSLLEDGNGDDLSLHQAMPVKKGEKWLANFWVWDP